MSVTDSHARYFLEFLKKNKQTKNNNNNKNQRVFHFFYEFQNATSINDSRNFFKLLNFLLNGPHKTTFWIFEILKIEI